MNTDRPLCKKCNKKPAAVNYKKNEKVYYRSLCDSCSRKKKTPLKVDTPRWESAGYKKLPKCEKCNFTAQFDNQLIVHFVDSNMNNTDWRNLKTICLNCSVELKMKGIGWPKSGLNPD
jgi:hypothetical protein